MVGNNKRQREWILMYSETKEMRGKRGVSKTSQNPIGLIEFYNSLNKNERILYREYQNDDAYYLDRRIADTMYHVTYDETVANIEALQMMGPAITVLYDNQIASCFGFATVFPSVAEAWCLGSKMFNKHPVATTRSAKFVLNYGAKYMALHRLQVIVHNENQVAKNWASVLQFNYEGLMKQFGHDKSDYVMYAKYY